MKNFHKQKENNTNNKDQLIIYGRHAVISALKNPKRRLQKLLITAENRAEIEKLGLKIPFTIIDKKDFAKFCPKTPSIRDSPSIANVWKPMTSLT